MLLEFRPTSLDDSHDRGRHQVLLSKKLATRDAEVDSDRDELSSARQRTCPPTRELWPQNRVLKGPEKCATNAQKDSVRSFFFQCVWSACLSMQISLREHRPYRVQHDKHALQQVHRKEVTKCSIQSCRTYRQDEWKQVDPK